MIGLAPTNAVALDMKRDGFRDATTIHSRLFALNNGRARWSRRTVVIVDEAAMIDTRLMAMLTAHAAQSGAKLILAGDDRQLSSIDRGGMFAELRRSHGAASLTEVRRQSKYDERRATELLAEGNFHAALASYDANGAIRWRETPEAARAALVRQWAEDSAADPDKSRFVFAYTNVEVDRLNRDLRAVRLRRGELGVSHRFVTRHGEFEFANGDRLQLTGTDKRLGLINGQAGVITAIEGGLITVRLDGPDGQIIAFDATMFDGFRHGYAGTIYKGQGRTLDQTYLFHSEHWRSAASYVALSRHREATALFVARSVAPSLATLARQMARVDDRRAAAEFHRADGMPIEAGRLLSPAELLRRLGNDPFYRHARTRQGFAVQGAAVAGRGRHPADEVPNARAPPPVAAVNASNPAEPEVPFSSGERSIDNVSLWRRLARWLTEWRRAVPARPEPRRPGRAGGHWP